MVFEGDNMKIYVGADHRGFHLKAEILDLLRARDFTAIDLGSFAVGEACDYPEISFKVAQAVATNPGSRGILVCMTGIGHTIAANKVPGAYAALCYNCDAAVLSREHNNANILVLGAKFVAPDEVKEIVTVWLATEFAGGRHQRRVQQIKEIEKKFLKTND
jgi:RpiB/LacA/LacB family sugar-phosphate isomerase